jgi:hypothetical protein
VAPEPVEQGPPADEAATDFVADDAEQDEDRLERSILAIGLARRLHSIWRRTNDKSSVHGNPQVAHEGSRGAFVVHLDAPWGGGKTTFANFLSHVLNPCPGGSRPARFLRERYGDLDLGGIFLEDPPLSLADARYLKGKYSENVRRPWSVVYFNAWQMEHIKPPWWAFYQAIRQSCFDSIRREGDDAWDPTRRVKFKGPAHWWAVLKRFDKWLGLWSEEFAWRFTNPKIYSLLVTACICLLILSVLLSTGAWGLIATKEGSRSGFLLSNPIGLLLTGVGGITGLWGLSALFTESIIPGTDTLAERLNLGSGDPFGRFRRHFARTIERVRRPVLVIVDDLDRCQPPFVVDLIRGIQTLLRSPRVVFVILGDRDWIERAFEAEHESMRKVDVGPEQTFGARFVEKAIQMSFILPALGPEARLAYVRHVVLGERAERASSRVSAIHPAAAARLRDFVKRQAARPEIGTFDTVSILERVGHKLWGEKLSGGERSVGEVLEEAGAGQGSAALEQIVSETLAIHAASDEQTEQEARHELERFARFFPANPRQIKRIVNSITIYYAVAIQRPGLVADERFRAQLAIWIILMTEWPQTWRLLASYPDLVSLLTAADPKRALRRPGLVLPGSIESTGKAIEPILADRDLMDIIAGNGLEPLHPDQVRVMALLTPLHSRVRRWSEAADAEGFGNSPATSNEAPRA